MENPKLALIPSGYKSGKVYSILPVNGVGDFDFSRNTESSRVNKEGLIETVNNNVPRLDWLNSDCPSLLLQPQRTNYVNYSQDITQSIWNKKNINYDSNVIDPSGNTNAFKIYPNTTYAEHYLEQSNLATTQTTYIGSVFIKDGGTSVFEIIIVHVGIGSAISRATFTITNGVVNFNTLDGVIQSVNIKDFGNGWYRCELKYNFSSSVSSHRIRVLPKNNAQYVGDNFSGVNVYGIQVEQGSYPTSYIKNSTSGIVTRQEDECINGGDADLFSSNEGVLYAEISALADDLTFRVLSLSDGTNNNTIKFGFRSDSNRIYTEVRSNASSQVFLSYDVSDITDFNKIALKYKVNDFSLFINGVERATDISGNVPIGLNTLNFNRGDINNKFYGNVKSVEVYKDALTDSELQKLTK